jgi:hypothetical protein
MSIGPNYGTRVLPDGRILAVVPLTFGRARLHIGPPGSQMWDDGW